MKYAGYKLEDFYNKLSNEFSLGKEIIIFCARGGMRSLTVHNVFESIGIKNYKLDKGYKGYRKFLLDKFPEILNKVNFIVVHGKTGIGKTKILNSLNNLGYPVIDLEKAANHRASFLGGVNLGEQNSQKQFESIVFHQLMDIIKKFEIKNNGKINVFIEGESKRIGKILIPEYIYEIMNKGMHVFIESPKEVRVKNLMEDYFKIDEESFNNNKYNVKRDILEEFRKSLLKLEKYASEKEIDNYLTLFDSCNYIELAIDLMEKYYDPKYTKSMSKHEFKHKVEVKNNEDFLQKMKEIYEEIN